ncbi:hypothetical protein [uncultured Campylobacter sp.]
MQKYSQTLKFGEKSYFRIHCAYDTVLEVELHTDKDNIAYKMQ